LRGGSLSFEPESVLLAADTGEAAEEEVGARR